MLDALFGQIFLVTLVARLVSVFGTVRARDRRGFIRWRGVAPARPE